MATDFGTLIEPVARALLGEPNAHLSSPTELRFGSHGSVSVDLAKGTYFDHEQTTGGGTLALIEAQTGLKGRECVDWLREHGLAVDDDERPTNGKHAPGGLGKIVATYDYTDEAGALLFQVVRYEPKTFRQRRRVSDGWSWSVKGVRQVPYRLPELIEALAVERVVFVVEGEKDADNLARIGVPATCNAGGVGKWRANLTAVFADADVVIIEDNDPQARTPEGELRWHPDGRPVLPGQDHAQAVAAALSQVARRVRLLNLKKVWPQLPDKGDVTDWIAAGEGDAGRLYEIIEQVPDWKQEIPAADEPAQEPAQPARYIPTKAILPDVTKIPRRSFAYATQYILGSVGCTIADGGVGKSNLVIAECVALATGRNILGVPVPMAHKVFYWNGEEPIEEIERRIHAVCQHYDINPRALDGRLHYQSGLVEPIIVAQMKAGAIGFDLAAARAIEDIIVRNSISIMVMDPFVSLHRISENDNTNIDAVVKLFSAIAHRTRAAFEIVHHTRKASAAGGGDMSLADARGASALINAARTARVLNRMTEAQAREADVADHRQYFRSDNGKANYAPAQMATWFKIVAEHLPNGDTEHPGDSVATLQSFKFPGPFDGVTTDHLDKVRAAIRTNGRCRYSDKSDDWVGHVVAQVVGINAKDQKARLKSMIDTWIKNGQLYRNERRGPQRKLVEFVDAERINEADENDEPTMV